MPPTPTSRLYRLGCVLRFRKVRRGVGGGVWTETGAVQVLGCGWWRGAVGVWVFTVKGVFYGFAQGLVASLVAQFQLPPTSGWRPGGWV